MSICSDRPWGLVKPWYVDCTAFDPAKKRLDLYIDCRARRHVCVPRVRAVGLQGLHTSEKTWPHLNFFEHEAFLHVRTARVKCAEHGVKLTEVPWARHGSGFTLLFEAYGLALAKDTGQGGGAARGRA